MIKKLLLLGLLLIPARLLAGSGSAMTFDVAPMVNGVSSTLDQTIGGNKTFTGSICGNPNLTFYSPSSLCSYNFNSINGSGLAVSWLQHTAADWGAGSSYVNVDTFTVPGQVGLAAGQSNGSFRSQVYNAGPNWSSWGTFNADATVPDPHVGGGVTFEAYTSTSADTIFSGSPFGISRGATIGSSVGPYIAIVTYFDNFIGPPVLNSFTLSWLPNPNYFNFNMNGSQFAQLADNTGSLIMNMGVPIVMHSTVTFTSGVNLPASIITYPEVASYSITDYMIGYQPGNVLLISADTERTVTNPSVAYKEKEIQIARGGTVTITIDGKGNQFYQILLYKNGSQVQEWYVTMPPGTYQTYWTTLAVSPGDLIQIYLYLNWTGQCWIKNFRIWVDSVNSTNVVNLN